MHAGNYQASILSVLEQQSCLLEQGLLVLMAAYGLSLCQSRHISPLTSKQRESLIQEPCCRVPHVILLPDASPTLLQLRD